MSTVLTKPVLLDETGQAIVGKLQDIQQAIGGTGEFIPINIRVTTPPTKTNYLAGETLDLSGMVVTLVANNGGMYDVTGDCVFSPADGSTVTSSTTEVNISYTWYKDSTVFTAVQPIGIKELASIAVTTPPTVTDYYVGETLDLTGIVVTATFNDGATEIVTNDCTFSPADGDTLTMSDSVVSISYTLAGVTKTTTQALSLTSTIYGVEWDGTATTAWTRTDLAADFVDPDPYYAGRSGTSSSPFDEIMPWAGMVKETRSGGTMVKIPKFWYKLTQNGNSLKIQISNRELDGFSVSPAHMDRGDGVGERDFVYVGRYHSTGVSNYASATGSVPSSYITRATARASSKYGKSRYWQSDFAMRFTLWLLYLVEFADWNSQEKIGYGCGNRSAFVNTGYTDSMPYHTGTTQSNRTDYGSGIQYRNIEGLWDNLYEYCDGCYVSENNGNKEFYMIMNPSNFSDSSGGILVGNLIASRPSKFEIKNVNGLFPIFWPTESSGSDNTYMCDAWNINADGPCLTAGGCYYYQNQSSGLFYLGRKATNTDGNYTGSRLMELPANT